MREERELLQRQRNNLSEQQLRSYFDGFDHNMRRYLLHAYTKGWYNLISTQYEQGYFRISLLIAENSNHAMQNGRHVTGLVKTAVKLSLQEGIMSANIRNMKLKSRDVVVLCDDNRNLYDRQYRRVIYAE